MPSERLAACFQDILAAVDLIQGWIADLGGIPQAIHNPLVRSAIERQLLVISEAAVRLHKLDPMVAPKLAPDVDWAGVRGIGNFIRHKYDDLDTRSIADVLQNRLVSLHSAARAALAELSGSSQTG